MCEIEATNQRSNSNGYHESSHRDHIVLDDVIQFVVPPMFVFFSQIVLDLASNMSYDIINRLALLPTVNGQFDEMVDNGKRTNSRYTPYYSERGI